jgi:hypothetical protein
VTLSKTTRQGQVAKDFYSRVFKPSFDAFQVAARKVPLVIMLWGPRRRSQVWSETRLQIRDRLQQLGHTVYLSEQLGIPTSASKQKGVEYLQRDAVDLIVATQLSYEPVGAVNHFVEFRVIDSKMLLFVDEAAADRHLYQRAVTELRTCYNNVETFELPEDIARDNLLRKIVEKVNLMQSVKHRAIQRARGWGLRLEESGRNPSQPTAPLQPFRYNLLELYREHRDEIDVLNDLMLSFFLAHVNHVGQIPIKALSQDVGLAEDSMSQQVAPLLRSEMLTQANGILAATAYGKRMLDGLGLGLPAAPVSVPRTAPVLPAILRTRLATFAAGAGLALAAVFLFALALINGANTVQNQQPLVLTPLRPAISATSTHIPTLTPMPPSSR